MRWFLAFGGVMMVCASAVSAAGTLITSVPVEPFSGTREVARTRHGVCDRFRVMSHRPPASSVHVQMCVAVRSSDQNSTLPPKEHR